MSSHDRATKSVHYGMRHRCASGKMLSLLTTAGLPPAPREKRAMRRTVFSPVGLVAVFLLALVAAVCAACAARPDGEGPDPSPPEDHRQSAPRRPSVGGGANGVVFVDRQSAPKPLEVDPGHGVATERPLRDAGAYSLSSAEAVAFGEGSVWLTERFTWDAGPCQDTGACAGYESGLLTRLDPDTLEPLAGWKLRDAYDAEVAFGAGSVWATKEGSVLQIDPDTNKVVREVPVGPRLRAIAFGAGSVWAAGAGRGVFRLDPEKGAVVDTIEVGGRGAYDVDFGEGAVWVAASESLARIEPGRGGVACAVEVPGKAYEVAAGAGAVWAIGDGGTLVRVDPRTREVADTLDLGGQLWDVEASEKGAWAVSRRSTGERSPPVVRLVRVDPDTSRVDGAVQIEGTGGDAAIGGDAAWLVATDGAYTGDTLTKAALF